MFNLFCSKKEKKPFTITPGCILVIEAEDAKDCLLVTAFERSWIPAISLITFKLCSLPIDLNDKIEGTCEVFLQFPHDKNNYKIVKCIPADKYEAKIEY